MKSSSAPGINVIYQARGLNCFCNGMDTMSGSVTTMSGTWQFMGGEQASGQGRFYFMLMVRIS